MLPDDWAFVGYTYGGITFPLPRDVGFYELTPQDQAAGFILICANDDFTLQLRALLPGEMTWAKYKKMMLEEPTAEVNLLGENQDILFVRNTAPTAVSELTSIALNGLDGNLYKISIFTGSTEDFSSDAAVWGISEMIAAHTSQMDFSDWPLAED